MQLTSAKGEARPPAPAAGRPRLEEVDHFVSLLCAHGLDALPKYLAERIDNLNESPHGNSAVNALTRITRIYSSIDLANSVKDGFLFLLYLFIQFGQ